MKKLLYKKHRFRHKNNNENSDNDNSDNNITNSTFSDFNNKENGNNENDSVNFYYPPKYAISNGNWIGRLPQPLLLSFKTI